MEKPQGWLSLAGLFLGSRAIEEPELTSLFLAPPDFRCPRSYVKLGSKCYYFSRDRMGWIEAKKTCELMTDGSRLVSIETPAERDLLLKQVAKQSRSRFEFWTAGNDIDDENRWVWAGTGGEKVRGNGDRNFYFIMSNYLL